MLRQLYAPSNFFGTWPLFPTIFQETRDAVNKPRQRPQRCRTKRSQLKTESMGKKRWSKRSTESGQFMDQKEKRNSRASGGRGDVGSQDRAGQ